MQTQCLSRMGPAVKKQLSKSLISIKSFHYNTAINVHDIQYSNIEDCAPIIAARCRFFYTHVHADTSKGLGWAVWGGNGWGWLRARASFMLALLQPLLCWLICGRLFYSASSNRHDWWRLGEEMGDDWQG